MMVVMMKIVVIGGVLVAAVIMVFKGTILDICGLLTTKRAVPNTSLCGNSATTV